MLTKDQARGRVRDAVRHGRLVKPSACEECYAPTPTRLLDGHHFNGYDDPLSVKWVCRRCHSRIDSLEQKKFGEANGWSALSDAEALQIKDLRSYGLPVATIAETYRVSDSTVFRILRGETYNPARCQKYL